MDRPRSTSCETYQHSSDVKGHKAKITHSTYSINSILKSGFAKRTCAVISKYHKVKYDRPGECSPEKDCLR